MSEHRNNWARNYTYSAARLHYPETIEQLQELVRSGRKLKVLGSRHSFNDIADTPGDQISLDRLVVAPVVDRERRTVTVGAGVRYGQICRYLDREGYALHNLASLPHISVGGACATSTHGSGEGNGSLATAVAGIEMVTADGELMALSRGQSGPLGERFVGVVVALGGLGVVTKLTLDIEPAFQMRQVVYENLPLAQLEEHFEQIEAAAYSVSLFTDWRTSTVNQVWLKSRVVEAAPFEPPSDLFGAAPAPTNRHPIVSISPVNCTEQMGVPGPWYDRLPHFRMDFTPSSGEELQTEYLVPLRHAMPALRAVDSLRDRVAPLLQISEIRTIAADELWMSPFYRQACVAIHFTWQKDWPAVRRLLPLIEAQLAPFDARPHWGKLFTMPAERVQSLYERLPDFRHMLGESDPEGKFRNAFLDKYIFGEH